MMAVSRNLSFSLAVLGLVLVGLLHAAEAGPIRRSKAETDKVQLVMDKLENFVNKGLKSSGVTIKELRDAYDQSTTWDLKTYDNLRHSTPLFRLMTDFVLTPMEKFNDLVKMDWKDKDVKQLCDDYISRLHNAYKTVRPLYLGKTIWHNYKIVSNKIDDAIISLAGLNKAKPLTRKALNYAKDEYDAYMARVDDIATNEDIFFKQDELIKIYNMLNRAETQAMVEEVFPIMDKLNDDKALADVSKLYRARLERDHKIYVRNGRFVRYT